MLEKTLESPLDSKAIQPVHPKGNQPWTFIGRTDTDAETPILWPPDGKNWLLGKHPDAGEDWGQEKGETEDEMVGWHHQFNGHEFEQTPEDSEGQGSLACCSPWGRTRLRDRTTTTKMLLGTWPLAHSAPVWVWPPPCRISRASQMHPETKIKTAGQHPRWRGKAKSWSQIIKKNRLRKPRGKCRAWLPAICTEPRSKRKLTWISA